MLCAPSSAKQHTRAAPIDWRTSQEERISHRIAGRRQQRVHRSESWRRVVCVSVCVVTSEDQKAAADFIGLKETNASDDSVEILLPH